MALASAKRVRALLRERGRVHPAPARGSQFPEIQGFGHLIDVWTKPSRNNQVKGLILAQSERWRRG